MAAFSMEEEKGQKERTFLVIWKAGGSDEIYGPDFETAWKDAKYTGGMKTAMSYWEDITQNYDEEE